MKNINNEKHTFNIFRGRKISETIIKHAELVSDHLKQKNIRTDFLEHFKQFVLESETQERWIPELSKRVNIEKKVVTNIIGFLFILTVNWISKDVKVTELEADLRKLIKNKEIEQDLIKFFQTNKSSFIDVFKEITISFSPEIRNLTYKVYINFKDENSPFNPKARCMFKLDYDDINDEEKSFQFETSENDIDQLIVTLQEAKQEIKKAKKYLKNARKE